MGSYVNMCVIYALLYRKLIQNLLLAKELCGWFWQSRVWECAGKVVGSTVQPEGIRGPTNKKCTSPFDDTIMTTYAVCKYSKQQHDPLALHSKDFKEFRGNQFAECLLQSASSACCILLQDLIDLAISCHNVCNAWT